jgi:hypothetical protein
MNDFHDLKELDKSEIKVVEESGGAEAERLLVLTDGPLVGIMVSKVGIDKNHVQGRSSYRF